MHHNLCGVLLVVFYLLQHASNNRLSELKQHLALELRHTETSELGETIGYIKEVL